MNSALQDRVIPLFHYALREDGYSVPRHRRRTSRASTRLFATVDKAHRIFRRRTEGRAPAARVPALDPRAAADPVAVAAAARSRPTAACSGWPSARCSTASGRRYAVVNAEGDVLHISARTGKYLELPAGTPDRSTSSPWPGPASGSTCAAPSTARPATGEIVVQNEIGVGTNGGRQLIDLARAAAPPRREGRRDPPRRLPRRRRHPERRGLPATTRSRTARPPPSSISSTSSG